MSDAKALAELAASLSRIEGGQARIERRQAAYEVVAHRLIGMMEVHNAKLDEIIQLATRQPGPSPVAQALAEILAALRDLPEVLARTIRDELQRELEAEGYETEPAEPGAFDRDQEDRP